MKGNNELTLNQETMIEAVQIWLNAQMVLGKAPKVEAVIKASSSGLDGGTRFVVSLTDHAPDTRT